MPRKRKPGGRPKNCIVGCIQVREATANGQTFRIGRIESDGSETLLLAVSQNWLLRWYTSPEGRYSYREYRLAVPIRLADLKIKNNQKSMEV
jgi:hypothetical protein